MGTLFMLIALYFLNFDRIFLLVFFSIWVLYTLPTLYLHFRYFLINKGQEIIIMNDELVLKYNNREDFRIFAKQEIEKIVLCRSASLDKGGVPLSSIETYQYVRIFLNTGYVINITNLMTPYLDDVLNQFKGVCFVRKKGVFCLFSL
jgi:hypothetical protein